MNKEKNKKEMSDEETIIIEFIAENRKLKRRLDIMFFMLVLLALAFIWLVNLLMRLNVI